MRGLLPEPCALQHERAPRPLPLFLELVRQAAERDPQLARDALRGLNLYAQAPRPAKPAPRAEVLRIGPAAVRDHGGTGPPLLLVPSLINPPHVLDLDRDVSLADALAGRGRQVLLLDWGRANDRSGLSVSDHVAELLVPLIERLGNATALVGYCLGGTMAIAAASLTRCRSVATLAAPWRFARYPDESRTAIEQLWRQSEAGARALGALPMEVLQAAFWSIDPGRTVRKFARFADAEPESPAAARFVTLEDWANEGEPLPLPAARELIEDFFIADRPGRGCWSIGGRLVGDRLDCPLLNLTAGRDRIAPASTAAAGERVALEAGHVGMVVGSARTRLHQELRRFLDLEAGGSQG